MKEETMKQCPHCGSKLNFIQFLTGYGSDTLFKHPAEVPAHEHRCLSCHRVVWLRYDRLFFERRFRQSLSLHLLFSAALTFFGVKPVLAFTDLQALLFMVIAMLFGGVIIKAYARYESVALKADKV